MIAADDAEGWSSTLRDAITIPVWMVRSPPASLPRVRDARTLTDKTQAGGRLAACLPTVALCRASM